MFRDLSFNEFNGTLPLLPDSIELLDLSHNLLDDLPSSLPGQLRRLDLSRNEFKLIHLPNVSPRIDPQQCILYGDSDENCFLNVTNNECGSCFGAFGCSRREVFNPGCVPIMTALPTVATPVTSTTLPLTTPISSTTTLKVTTASTTMLNTLLTSPYPVSTGQSSTRWFTSPSLQSTTLKMTEIDVSTSEPPMAIDVILSFVLLYYSPLIIIFCSFRANRATAVRC